MVHYTFGIRPIPLTAVSVDSCHIWLDSTLDKILDACTRFLPAFPYAHSYASAKPLIRLFEVYLGIRKFEVLHPSTDGLTQGFFPAFVTHPVTPARDEFEFRPHLLQAFGVDAEPSHPIKWAFVERVAEELHFACVADFRFLAIDLQVKFLLDESGQSFAYSFRSTSAFAED